MGKIKMDEVYSANTDMFKVINRNSWKTCEICSKLTIKQKYHTRRRSGVIIANFEQISDLFLVFLLLTLNN